MACRILGNIYKLIIWAAISVFRSQSFCLSFSSHKKGFPLEPGCGLRYKTTVNIKNTFLSFRKNLASVYRFLRLISFVILYKNPQLLSCGFNIMMLKVYHLFVYHLQVFLKNIIRAQKVGIVIPHN